jgi:hypothetical protein
MAIAAWTLAAAAGRVAPDFPGIDVGDSYALAAHAPEAATFQPKGRFKQEGENCVWDAKDDGPNQCTPRTPGRFKQQKEGCVWDDKDNGPDQCTPPRGRWKLDGERCYWDPKDDGPRQCNPRQPRKSGR